MSIYPWIPAWSRPMPALLGPRVSMSTGAALVAAALLAVRLW
ncbi:hypothetical protein [Nocardia brasiliensis]|nr:hypothetical protein [Nocardia brasiliensis]